MLDIANNDEYLVENKVMRHLGLIILDYSSLLELNYIDLLAFLSDYEGLDNV